MALIIVEKLSFVSVNDEVRFNNFAGNRFEADGDDDDDDDDGDDVAPAA